METFLLQGLALGLTAAASPGLFQTFLINQALSGGWSRAARLAFAPMISDIPIVLSILFLLNRLPTRFLSAISLAGGLFALYLAWTGWQAWRSVASAPVREAGQETETGSRSLFLRGVMMNALSSGPYTFWSLVNGPLLLSALKISAGHATAFLLGFYAMFVGGMLLIVAIFHQARRLGPGLVRNLSLLSLALLFVFAIILLRQGITGLLA